MIHATVRDRGDLIAENVLLRQQLAVLTRPTRTRPRLRALDNLFWVLAVASRGCVACLQKAAWPTRGKADS
jgi:hypothetical protein